LPENEDGHTRNSESQLQETAENRVEMRKKKAGRAQLTKKNAT